MKFVVEAKKGRKSSSEVFIHEKERPKGDREGASAITDALSTSLPNTSKCFIEYQHVSAKVQLIEKYQL